MNRREMLAAGFRRLAQALPGLVSNRTLGAFLTGGAPVPPRRQALSFPQKSPKLAPQGQIPQPEED